MEIYEKSKLRVLARIPKVSASGSEGCTPAALPEEEGRMISQTVAFRLLTATALLLLVVAILPYSMSDKTPKPAAASASSTSSPAADTLPWTPAIASEPQKATDDGPQMSVWPRPGQSSSTQFEGHVEAMPLAGNQPPVAQAAQYQADARVGY